MRSAPLIIKVGRNCDQHLHSAHCAHKLDLPRKIEPTYITNIISSRALVGFKRLDCCTAVIIKVGTNCDQHLHIAARHAKNLEENRGYQD